MDIEKCPFCGHLAEIKSVDADHISDKYWIACTNDACTVEQTMYWDLDEAITKWNNRV